MKTILKKTILDTNRGTKEHARIAGRCGSRRIEQEEAEAAEDCPHGRTGSYHSWLAVLAYCFLLSLAVLSCAKHGPAAKPADVEYYTCTMHPSVKSQDPNAKCPICSMSLVPVMKKKNRGTGEPEKRGDADGGPEHISGTAMPTSATT